MQTILLACYICLQLTASPDAKQSCDQCITGLLEQTGISSNFGDYIASHSALDEIFDKFNVTLPQESFTTQNEPEMVQSTKVETDVEALIKACEDKTEKEIQEKLEKNEAILQNYETQLNRKLDRALELLRKSKTEEISTKVQQLKANLDEEFATFVEVKRASLTRSMEEIIHGGAKPIHNNTLENSQLLISGDSLVSENGQYGATMQKSGELIITDRNGGIVNKLGSWINDNSDHFLMMQEDCNLVVYDSNTIKPKWSLGVYDPEQGKSCYLKLSNEGELALYKKV